MERKHTPGPWTLGDPAHEHTSGRAWTVPVWANEAPSGDKIAGEAMATSRKTARANARLIAAAPDLLEALAQIVAECEAGTHDSGTSGMAAARAAIAKAGGGK